MSAVLIPFVCGRVTFCECAVQQGTAEELAANLTVAPEKSSSISG